MKASELEHGDTFRFPDSPTEYYRVTVLSTEYEVYYCDPVEMVAYGCAEDLEVVLIRRYKDEG